jgi:L-ascorbate metabolism protein UlaG (beta-lactamase superfamily)
MVEDDTMRVVIDAHQRRTDAFFIDPPSGAWAELEAGSGQFAAIRLALGSHNHEDHILPASVVSALSANAALSFAGPGGITALLGAAPRVTRLDVPRGERRDAVIGGMAVSAFHLRHFNAFNTDFGGVENYAWLVTVGGKRVLHLGDSDLTPENLAQFSSLPAMDIVIVPSWGALVTSSTATAVISTTRAGRVIATHLRFGLGDIDEQAVLSQHPDAIVHRTPYAFHRF